MTAAAPRPSLAQLALLFALGATGFGGPAAHIALMEDEVVRRRGWLTHAEFLDLLAATNLIPGPNSTEMAIHIGLRAGWAGFVVAGLCFILPAALLTGVLAALYVEFRTLPEIDDILYGIKPVVIALVLQALWRLGQSCLKLPFLAAVAAAAGVLNFVGVDELAVLLGAGLVVMAGRWFLTRHERGKAVPAACLGAATATLASGAAGGAAMVGLWPLFFVFLKIGSVLFGSGYVLLAFLRSDLVVAREWLTEKQLLDAVAVGQVTPGPLFTTATFIGYLLGGAAGAVVATVGIFLPGFVFVALSGPLIPRLRRSPAAGAFLDGVVVGSLALMAVVSWELARTAIIDVPTMLLALLGAALLVRYRVNSAWLVLGGGLAGWLIAGLLGR